MTERPNPFYLRGEAYYTNDHRHAPLPENVREALQRLLESGEAVIQTAGHTISDSRAFAYIRGSKRPSDTVRQELIHAFG